MNTPNTKPDLAEPPPEPKIPSYSFLLMGAPGTGKTHSAATMANCSGIEKVCFLFTENSRATFDSDNFGPLAKHLGKKIHYMRALPLTGTFKDMIATADMVLAQNLQSLQSKPAIGGTNLRKAYHKILNSLVSYKCEITGEEFPAVDDWPSSWCLVLDSLTGLNYALQNFQVGNKPIMNVSDWQIVMNMEALLLRRLTGALDCQVIVTAHLTRERDEVTGTTSIFPNALGSKLGPVIPSFFDEVLMTKFTGGKFTWSTLESNADLKARMFPRNKELEPTFTQLRQLEKINV